MSNKTLFIKVIPPTNGYQKPKQANQGWRRYQQQARRYVTVMM